VVVSLRSVKIHSQIVSRTVTFKDQKSLKMKISFALPLILTALLVPLIHGQAVECDGPELDLAGDGSFLFRHSVNPSDSTISVELEYVGTGWVGFSFTEGVRMVPNVAIIGLPDAITVMKYDMTLRDISGVLPSSADAQTLTETSIVQENGSTIMRFTRAFDQTGETTLVPGGTNLILAAYGTSNTLGYHLFRVASSFTLLEYTGAPATAPVEAPTGMGAPTGADVPVTIPVEAPVEAPALNMTSSMPTLGVSAAPSVNMTTASPTSTPTMSPVMNTTAPSISLVPSMSPKPILQPVEVSPKPIPLEPVPTVSPTNTPLADPSAAQPTRVNTIPPVVTNPVDSTISGIQVRFSGIGTISGTDILRLQSEMEQWFTAYFNEEEEQASPRSLRQAPRMLQLRVPDVRNMDTVYDVAGQDSSSSGENTVTYTQSLSYDATADALTPDYYTLLPFVDSPYKELLLQRLSNSSNSFTSLSAIATPVVPVDSGGLSLAAIIGISAGGVVGLLLLAYGGYALGSRRKGTDTGIDERNDTTNRREDAGIINNEISEPHIGNVIDRNNNDSETIQIPSGLVAEVPTQACIHDTNISPHYEVSQKDQCRTVVGDPIRIVNATAVLHPNKSQDDVPAIPIATTTNNGGNNRGTDSGASIYEM
jgi:hypothetical protein